MKVIGVSLTCSEISARKDNPDVVARDEEEIKLIFSFRKGALFQAAAVMELILHCTQTFPVCAGAESRTARFKSLREVFARWCIQGLVQKEVVMKMIRSLENMEGSIKVFTSYFSTVADQELSWGEMLSSLL
ncbi:unnamed protein product [Phytomonas sp. Hart1]|nr:unnamed protein product [Phytomonas sp. Hart1]|eukprot:CCW72058.1 unnamed protein product [Phytomonas sp. isolate Hart1]